MGDIHFCHEYDFYTYSEAKYRGFRKPRMKYTFSVHEINRTKNYLFILIHNTYEVPHYPNEINVKSSTGKKKLYFILNSIENIYITFSYFH